MSARTPSSGARAASARDPASAHVARPALPAYPNAASQADPGEPDAVRARFAEHLGKPVHFVGEIEPMDADGARVFVKAGPGRVRTGHVGRILGELTARRVPIQGAHISR